MPTKRSSNKKGRKKKPILEKGTSSKSFKDEVEKLEPLISHKSQILQAQEVIRRLQVKYKHKLEEVKENEYSHCIQIVQTDLPSPSKVAKLEMEMSKRLHGGTTDKPDHLPSDELGQGEEEPSDKEKSKAEETKQVHRRLNVRTRTRIMDQRPTPRVVNSTKIESVRENDGYPISGSPLKQSSKESTSILVDKPTDNTSKSITPTKRDYVLGFKVQDTPVERDTSRLSCSPLSSMESFASPLQSPEPEGKSKKPSYMRILDFKTPIIETKKKVQKRKPKTEPPQNEEEWAKEMNKEFAEVEKFDLVVL